MNVALRASATGGPGYVGPPLGGVEFGLRDGDG